MKSPECMHRPVCPGCPLLDTPTYEESLELKRERVTHHLDALGLKPNTPVEVHGAEIISGWRARARYVVDRAADTPERLLGFYAPGSREFLPIAFCQAHRPAIERAMAKLKLALIETPQLLAVCAFVEARSIAGEDVEVTLCLRDAPEDAAALWHIALAAASIYAPEDRVSLALRVGGQGASIGSGDTIQLTRYTAPERFVSTTSTRAIKLPSGGFFQQHPEQLAAAHRVMLRWLGDTPPTSLLDLYSGVGVHGLSLLAHKGSLIATDIDASAIEALNASLSAGEGVLSHTAALDDHAAPAWLSDMLGEGERLDAIVTNPGRAGMHYALTGWLMGESARSRVDRGLLYMSCNIDTLARDLARLTADGHWVLERVAILDMMPFTAQIEVLAHLTPGEPTATRAHTERARDLDARSASPRQLSPGVSGVAAHHEGRSVWVAVVAGKTPKQGKLPTRHGAPQRAQITCTRIFEDGSHVSGIRLECEGLSGDVELRERLRAWGHPVLGDPDFGRRKVNRRAAMKDHVDRLLLHCVIADEEGEDIVEAPLEKDWPLRYWSRLNSLHRAPA